MIDPVAEWKRIVLAQVVEKERGLRRRPTLTMHVTLGFMLTAAALGVQGGWAGMTLSVLVLSWVFLVQELPRAWLARKFGCSSRIALSAAGAETEFTGPILRARSALAVGVVGSLANFAAIAAMVVLVRPALAPQLAPILDGLAIPHLAWGAAQALPLVPFQAGLAISARLRPSARLAHAAGSLALLVTAGIALLASTKAYLLFGLVAFAALSAARTFRRGYAESCDEQADLTRSAEAAEAHLSAGEPFLAAERAKAALAEARSTAQRATWWRILARAALAQEDLALARQALRQVPEGALDLQTLCTYLIMAHREDEALSLLTEARALGHKDPESTRLMIDLLFGRDDHEAAIALAETDGALLSVEDRRAIRAATCARQSAS